MNMSEDSKDEKHEFPRWEELYQQQENDYLKGLIVEGVVAAGKTTVIQEIQLGLAEMRPGCTKVFLSEHYTERVLEDKKAQKTLTAGEVIKHSDSILALAKRLALLKSSSKFKTKTGNASIYMVLERFLGSHFANLSTLGIWNTNSSENQHIRDIYSALAELGFSVLILTIVEDQIAEAIDRTRTYRNSDWLSYLDSIGDSVEVGCYYKNWQHLMLTFYRSLESVCPIHRVEVVPSKDSSLYRQLARIWIQ
jgi:thymidylate kinase